MRQGKKGKKKGCCSKRSHFNEENEQEVSLVPPTLPQCFSIHGCLHSSKILKLLCQVEMALGEVPAGTPCGIVFPVLPEQRGHVMGKGLARSEECWWRDTTAMGDCSRGMG